MAVNADSSGQVLLGSLKVNRIGFGGMRIVGNQVWGVPKDHDNSIRVLKAAVKLGVNFIDTADAYGPEISENLIHEALHPYNDIVIATKGGLTRPSAGEWIPDGSSQHLQEAIAGSLDRLGVSTINIYQLHSPDPKVPFETSVRALMELQMEGKIKHIGLSNISLDQLKQATDMCEIVSVQNQYNVMETKDSDSIVDYCTDHHIAFIPYFPLGGNGTSLRQLSKLADKYQASERQIAIAWLLARSPIMLPIPGTQSIEHLEENIASGNISLSDADIDYLNTLAYTK
jgi:pyridoxine 4-dehydrogenase